MGFHASSGGSCRMAMLHIFFHRARAARCTDGAFMSAMTRHARW